MKVTLLVTSNILSNHDSSIHFSVGGVMVRVFSSSAVDRGFERRSGQTEDNTIGICGFSMHTTLRKSKE